MHDECAYNVSTKEESMPDTLMKKAAAVLLAAALCGCAGTASMNHQDRNSSQNTETEEAPASADSGVSASCIIDGTPFDLPVPLQDFISARWTIRLNDETAKTVNYQDPSETILVPGEYVSLQMRKDQDIVYALVLNRSCVNQPVTSADVFQLEISGNNFSERFETYGGISQTTSVREIREILSPLEGYEEGGETISLKRSPHETVLGIELSGNSVSSITVCAMNPWMFRQYMPGEDAEKAESEYKESAEEYTFSEEESKKAWHLAGTVTETEEIETVRLLYCRDEEDREFCAVFDPMMVYGTEICPPFEAGDEIEIWGNMADETYAVTSLTELPHPSFMIQYAMRAGEEAVQFMPDSRP